MVSRSRPDQPERKFWRLLERMDRLETMVYGRSSSVTNGRTRFIGLESLVVIGSQLVSGLLHVVGRITISGLGILEVLGLIDLTGTMRVQAGGEIVIGNVSIKDGKIIVGAGASQVIIDGATGKITAGNMVIDPTVSGGAMVFANGAQVFTDGTTIQIYKGNSVMQVSDSYARLQYGGSVISIGNDGIRMSGMEARTSAATGLPAGVIGIDGQTVFRVVA